MKPDPGSSEVRTLQQNITYSLLHVEINQFDPSEIRAIQRTFTTIETQLTWPD